MNDAIPGDPYRLAMEFEKIGQDFYANLAAVCDREEARQLFARLAKEEAGHYDVFLRLWESLRDKPAGVVDRDAALDAMRGHVLPSPQAVHEAALHGGRDKALDLALRMEDNSILYYRDLAAAFPGHQGDLAKIIQEEQRHVQLLMDLKLTAFVRAQPSP